MPAFLASWIKLRDHLSDDFLGGPRAVKLAWVINLQKGGTLPFVLGLMVAFDNFTAAHRAPRCSPASQRGMRRQT